MTETIRIHKAKRISTPWGIAQTSRGIGLGITFYTTASHGGYHVPCHLLDRIPAYLRSWAKSWSGDEAWYEEDCCWAAVCVAFPNLFPAEAMEHAKQILPGS